jgi:hypothetical protein
MRRPGRVGTVLVSVVAVACISAAPASSGDGGKQRSKREVLRIELRQAIPFTFIDHDQSGSATPGDQVILIRPGFRGGRVRWILLSMRW